MAEKYQLVTDRTSLILVKLRAEGQRASDMPELRTVPGMLAAGWGGRGTVAASRPSSDIDEVRFCRSSAVASPPITAQASGVAGPLHATSIWHGTVRQLQSKAAPRSRRPINSDKLLVCKRMSNHALSPVVGF